MPFRDRAGSEVYDAVAWGKAGEGIRTFDGSSGAHVSGGCGANHWAMLLCWVIAGRVWTGPKPKSVSQSRFDLVRVGKGELLVFDPRAEQSIAHRSFLIELPREEYCF